MAHIKNSTILKTSRRRHTPLDWQPLPGKKACRICIAKPFDGYDEQNWEAMINWFKNYVPKLETAFKGPIIEVAQQLKAHSFESAATNQLP